MTEDNQEVSMSEESAPESPSNFDLVREGLRCSPPGSPSFDIIASDVIDSTGDYY